MRIDMLKDGIQRICTRRQIHNIVAEAYDRYTKSGMENRLQTIIREACMDAINEKRGNNDRKANVLSALRDKKYKYSTLAYELWRPRNDSEKDTYRSLFSKKIRQSSSKKGDTIGFTEDEINRLYSLINNDTINR